MGKNKKKQFQAMREVVERKHINGNSVLPSFGVHAVERHYMDGKELKEFSGWTPGTNQFDGATLEDANKYIYNMPVQVGVNHYRRIKKAFQKGGMDAVNEYFNTIHQKMTANDNNVIEESIEDITEEVAPAEKKSFGIFSAIKNFGKRNANA